MLGSGFTSGSATVEQLHVPYFEAEPIQTLEANRLCRRFTSDKANKRPGDFNHLQEDVDEIQRAFQNLDLDLNATKTEMMICSLAPRGPPIPPKIPEILGKRLEVKDNIKYLGVVIDSRLSFGAHMVRQTVKVKQAVGALWRTLGRFATRKDFKEVYLRKLLPVLTYALPAACQCQACQQYYKLPYGNGRKSPSLCCETDDK